MWDTCLAEKEGCVRWGVFLEGVAPQYTCLCSPPDSRLFCGRFDGFHVYICAALLLRFAAPLKRMAFQDLVQFLQQL